MKKYYLLTPWCRVLLEKLTGLQLVKKFHAFHGTRRFITALTSVRHLSLSWANPIQSIYLHPTSWRSILILSTHLRLVLPSGVLPSGFTQQDPVYPNVNKNSTRCNSTQMFIYCKATLHVSGVASPITRSTKSCNRSLRYRSYYWYSYFPLT